MNKKVVNLTQHNVTAEQMADGIFDLPEESRKVLKGLLTFEEMPESSSNIACTAAAIAKMAVESGADAAMIGGAGYLMSFLERELWKAGITPKYAFSKRVSEEEHLPDGSVRKVVVFKYEGLIPAAKPL